MAERRRIDLGFNPLYASLSRNDNLDQAVVFDPKTQQLFHKDFPTTDPVSASAYIGLISASAATSQTNFILMFNGTSFVPVAQGNTFTFGINSFAASNFGSSTQQIGAGVWKAASSVNFTAEYNSGPPTEASVSFSGSTNFSDSGFTMGSTPFTSTTNPNTINYPSAVDSILKFSLSATKSIESSSNTTSTLVTFKNFRTWGTKNFNTSFSESVITDFSASTNSELSSNGNKSAYDFSVGSELFYVYAYRTAKVDQVDQVRCGEGANLLTVAMDPTNNATITPKTQPISVANGNSFTENYNIIASSGSNLSSHSDKMTVVNGTQIKNYFYHGHNASSGQETEIGVKSLQNSSSTNDDGGSIAGDTFILGQFGTATGEGSNKFVYVAIPNRDSYNTASFKDNNNFGFSMNDPVLINVTNSVGFVEEYAVYRSQQAVTYGASTNPSSLTLTVN